MSCCIRTFRASRDGAQFASRWPLPPRQTPRDCVNVCQDARQSPPRFVPTGRVQRSRQDRVGTSRSSHLPPTAGTIPDAVRPLLPRSDHGMGNGCVPRSSWSWLCSRQRAAVAHRALELPGEPQAATAVRSIPMPQPTPRRQTRRQGHLTRAIPALRVRRRFIARAPRRFATRLRINACAASITATATATRLSAIRLSSSASSASVTTTARTRQKVRSAMWSSRTSADADCSATAGPAACASRAPAAPRTAAPPCVAPRIRSGVAPITHTPAGCAQTTAPAIKVRAAIWARNARPLRRSATTGKRASSIAKPNPIRA
jgi:hypothetical protein